MQSKFGLKDLVMLLLIIGIGVMVFLTMKQDDRQWVPIREAEAKLTDQSAALARLAEAVEKVEDKIGSGGAPSAAGPKTDEALSRLASEMGTTNQRLSELLEATRLGYTTVRERLEEIQAQAAHNEAAIAERLAVAAARATPPPETAAPETGAPGGPAAAPAEPAAAPGVSAVAPAAPGTSRSSPPIPLPEAGAAAAPLRDESWARPGGGPVVWANPQHLATDPRAMPGFAEGGTFVEIFEGQPANITPYRYADVYGLRVVDQVCESLGTFDPVTLKMEGLLAEAWQYDPGGMWLRARIQPRARFSDGRPVTAEDVRFTFHDFIRNMEIEAERFRGTYNGIDEVKVISDKVVEITFKEKRFDNLQQAMLFPILPAHFYAKFTPSQVNRSTGLLMGSGPFKIAALDGDNQWAPPQDVVLVRNDQYWGEPPQVARLRFKTIVDSLARLTAYTNGDGDMVRPTPDQFRLKTDEPGFTDEHHALNWTNMRSGYAFIAWQCGERNGKLRPFHDKRVRLGMTHLIDRDRVLRDIYKGLGTVATGPFSPATEQADTTIAPWPYDVRKAMQLFTEAGWIDRNGDGALENAAGEPFEFEFTFSNSSEATERLARYLKDQCASVGIRCNLKPIDWSLFQTIQQNRDFDALVMAWSYSAPESDPNQVWHSSSIRNQGDNFIQWSSPEADRLIEEGRREVDDATRLGVWRQLHRHFHEEQPYTFLINMTWLRFVNKRVENVNTYPKGLEQREMFIRAENQAMLN